jgi:hypothetical protein
VDHGSRAAGLKLLSKVADDLVDIVLAVKVLSVVRCVDRDRDTLVRVESTRLEEALGGGGRTRDGDGHHGYSADIGLGRDWDASLLVEGVESLLSGSLGGASADGAPADLVLAIKDHGLLARVDHGTAAERQTNKVDSKRNQVGDVLGRNSGGGSEETGAESEHTSTLGRWELIGMLREVANEVAELSNGGESRLEHRNLLASLVVEVEQVVDGHEVGELLPLVRGQLLDLITESGRGALQEGGKTGIASTEDRLAEQRILLGGLIAEKENVRHYGD